MGTYTRIMFKRGRSISQIVEIDLGSRTRARQAARYLRVWMARMMALEPDENYSVHISEGVSR